MSGRYSGASYAYHDTIKRMLEIDYCLYDLGGISLTGGVFFSEMEETSLLFQ